MSLTKTYNGTSFILPTTGETDWGEQVTAFLADVADSAVTLSGTQTLSNKTIAATAVTVGGVPVVTTTGTQTLTNKTISAVALDVAGDAVVTVAANQNLTNKTLTAPVITTPTVTFGAGTAGAPSVTFDGDTDTGMYRPAANQIGLATDGTSRLTLSNSALNLSVDLGVTGNATVSGSLSVAGDAVVTATASQAITNKAITATSLTVAGDPAVTQAASQVVQNKTLTGVTINSGGNSFTPPSGRGTALQVWTSNGDGTSAWSNPPGTGTVTQVNAGTGLTGGPITSSGSLSLADTAVTPGSYTLSNITVDAQGRITAASSGSIPNSGVTPGTYSLATVTVAADGRVTSASSGAPTSSLTQSGPTYVVSGGTTTVTGKSILAAYEQGAGQAFNLTYNTRSDYTEQDSINGTDSVSGTFVLHNTAGAVIDSNTKLLIHADGVSGDTAIVDERGITPFGTSCMYFDGASYFKIPSSYKMAFGASQDFTVECWVRPTGNSASGALIFDLNTTGATASYALSHYGASGGQPNKFLMWTNGSGHSAITSSTTHPVDTWYHVAAVRRAGTMTLYVDGNAVGSSADTYSYSAATITLGSLVDPASGRYLEGWISNFRVSNNARYTGAFTRPTAEFTRDSNTVYLFRGYDGHGSQLIRDDSRSGHEISATLGNNVYISTAQAKFGSSSLYNAADTNGSRVVVAYSLQHNDFNFGSDDFTVDCWAYQTALTGAGQNTIFALGRNYILDPQVFVTSSGLLGASASTNGTTANVTFTWTGGTQPAFTTNQWNHVAMTRSGSTLYVFLNGTLAGSASVGTSSITQASSPSINIAGRWVGDLSMFRGYIDEFRVKRAEAVWTSAFTPPSVPYTTDDRTVLLLHFNGANNDRVTLDSSESSYANDNFADTTIPVLTFANSAALSSVQSRGGNGTSLALNGTNQYASIQYATPTAGHPLYFAPWEQFCLEGWFYISSLSSGPTFFAWSGVSNASGTSGYLWANTSGTLGLVVNGTTNTPAGLPTLTTGWHHLAVVREGRGWNVYVDGIGGTAANPAVNFSYPAENYVLWIGTDRGTSNYLNGAVDAIRVTHGSPRYTSNFVPGNLTQDDTTSLLWVFSGSNGQKWVKELSKNTALISATNARTVKDGAWIKPVASASNTLLYTGGSGKFGRSIWFNGFGAHLTGPTIRTSNEYTVDFWINFTNSVPATGVGWPILTQGSFNSNFGLYVDVQNISGTVYLRAGHYYDGLGNAYIWTAPLGFGLNTWGHVAVVRSGGMIKIYINGVMQTNNAAANPVSTTAGPITIGKDLSSSSTNFLNGVLIDELRISDAARWTSNFTVPTIPYGQQYVTGPYWVTTTNTSRINLAGYSDLYSVSVNETLTPSTSIKYLVSFDGRTTWKYWNGSAWATSTLANIDVNGITGATLTTALQGWTSALGTTLDIAASLKTANQNYTPVLDNVTVTTTKYTMMQPVTDYSVTRDAATGSQTLTFKRLKAGNANHVIDLVA